MINPSFVKAYENLNTAQKEAVDSTEGPLMVIAGPGTGKTELLALRVANIINKTEASPNNILCLTFTDNAAINMQERLVRYIGQDAYRVGIFTFHSFCNSIILDYPEYFYNAASFKNASDQDKSQIILDIFSSLPYSHPLASTHPEQGYVFLKDVLSRIKDLKAAGFSPSEYQEKIDNLEKQYDQINKVLRFYPEGRNSIKRLEEFRVFANELLAINSDCAMFLSQTLNQAINEASEMGKTTPIGDWKNKYTKKVDCDIVFTDSVKLEKIKGVAEIYNLYKQAMYNAALYDYDDMILDVALELKNNLTLRSELEDKYEYILIDEFQDTNEAQMNLVKAITSCSARPNIMVVGDDDQAIYRFQGAEISNIIEFRKNIYQDVKTIVLSKNYRSHQDILNFARGVVQNGSNRLEKHFSDINKALTQSNLNIDKCNININMYGSDTDEYENVAKEIKIQIENGIKPEEIAVLARNHRELQNILPFFDRHNIPYEYKNKSNVFDELHIKELINIMEYVSSVNSETINKDYLLPIILSFPYFNIPRLTLFEMAVEGKKNYTPWSELIIQYEDEKVKKVSLLLAELIAKADVLPLEHLIDYYVKESGFKDYYFSADILKNSPSTYIYFMASLKTFIDALREWRSEEVLLAKDIAPFVALHQERKISLTCDSPLIKASNCVQIMTAHSAKGLEFESVFLIATHDKFWTRGSRGSKAPIPVMLAPLIDSAGDNEDDFIRLFYVSITRAKHSLFISGHDSIIRYVPEELINKNKENQEVDISAYENCLSIVRGPYSQDEQIALKKLVENYHLSVTNMQNFLDVTKGGPAFFIEQNILRFPSAMPASAAFGSAVHKALEKMIIYPKQNASEAPNLDFVINVFNKSLLQARLEQKDYRKNYDKGVKILTAYYNKRYSFFRVDDAVEINMKNEGICINNARLTGKLDFLRTEDDGYYIIDFKTGKTSHEWDDSKSEDYEKRKLHNYRQQLIFYQILIENSARFKKPIKTLSLEFVESIVEEDSPVTLIYNPSVEEIERLKKLAQVVYGCIVNLDFPDVSHYEQDFSGRLQFEEDLIARVN